MTNEEFSISNIRKNTEGKLVSDVIGKLDEFLEKYSDKELLASGYNVPSDQGDRVSTSMRRYQTKDDKSSPVYVLRERSECFCGCGAGHYNLWAYNTLDDKLISRLKAQIDGNTHSLYFANVTSEQEKSMEKNLLFRISASKVGNKYSMMYESDISGIGVKYDTALDLIDKFN